jgi:hypothetical protein
MRFKSASDADLKIWNHGAHQKVVPFIITADSLSRARVVFEFRQSGR